MYRNMCTSKKLAVYSTVTAKCYIPGEDFGGINGTTEVTAECLQPH